jgi:hypothetical protein
MEFIARNINDGELFEVWLEVGVADGDIEYGDLSGEFNTDVPDYLEYYLRDDNFAELMGIFTRLMKHVDRSGGLYCDGIVSGRCCD